jgi:hypothetical protein
MDTQKPDDLLSRIAFDIKRSFNEWHASRCPKGGKHAFAAMGVGKRCCAKCGAEDWLFSSRANSSEPSLNWRRMR